MSFHVPYLVKVSKFKKMTQIGYWVEEQLLLIIKPT